MRAAGQSREDIQASVEASGMEIGERAQNRMDRWDARAAAKEKAQQVVENPVKQPVEENSNANVEQEPNTTPVHTAYTSTCQQLTLLLINPLLLSLRTS